MCAFIFLVIMKYLNSSTSKVVLINMFWMVKNMLGNSCAALVWIFLEVSLWSIRRGYKVLLHVPKQGHTLWFPVPYSCSLHDKILALLKGASHEHNKSDDLDGWSDKVLSHICTFYRMVKIYPCYIAWCSILRLFLFFNSTY